jgi:hypothetical protein
MTIDFDLFVLQPLIDLSVFGRVITVIPWSSQRTNPAPYTARGIWEARPYTIIQENQSPFTTTEYHIGLRIRDYTIQPTQGDHIIVDLYEYVLDSPEYDGQGGVEWVVKAVGPRQQTPFLTDVTLDEDVPEMDVPSPSLGSPLLVQTTHNVALFAISINVPVPVISPHTIALTASGISVATPGVP